MTILRPSDARGYADRGWLKSYHSFSFAEYYDPDHLHFSALRVINDDVIAGGAGFGMHSHRDMEIVTYMLSGALRHQDSMGNGSVIQSGDVQRMTAGSGVRHSEFNADANEPAHLLQIWIFPEENDLTPSYEEKHFSEDAKANQWCLIVSPTGQNGSLKIHQDAYIYATKLKKSAQLLAHFDDERANYLHIAKGAVSIDGKAYVGGDAIMSNNKEKLNIFAEADSELLWFDLPS
jgi:quercetin 2,3-dioxygenase